MSKIDQIKYEMKELTAKETVCKYQLKNYGDAIIEYRKEVMVRRLVKKILEDMPINVIDKDDHYLLEIDFCLIDKDIFDIICEQED